MNMDDNNYNRAKRFREDNKVENINYEGDRTTRDQARQRSNTRNNTRRRKCNKPITISKPLKGKSKKIALALAGVALAGAIIGGINSYANDQREHNEEVSISISKQFQEIARKEMRIEYIPETGMYDCVEPVSISPELSKLLHSTEADEKLNEYYSNQKKGDLDLSVAQLNNFSFNMLKALIADGMNIKIDEVKIQYIMDTFTSTVNVQAGEEHVQSYSGRGDVNYTEINRDLSLLLKQACEYKDDSSEVSKKEALKLYENIKLIANNYEIEIHDGKLVLVSREDGQRYLYKSSGEHTKLDERQQETEESR